MACSLAHRDHGIHVGRKRVARLMRAAGLRGASLRKFVVTTLSDTRNPAAHRSGGAALLCGAAQPAVGGGSDVCADLERVFVPGSRARCVLAQSRRLGDGEPPSHRARAGRDMAITMRRPRFVIHHSDHGCQYTSYAFGKRCREAGVMPSMGTVGDAYDNAMAESFFATLEREVRKRLGKTALAYTGVILNGSIASKSSTVLAFGSSANKRRRYA